MSNDRKYIVCYEEFSYSDKKFPNNEVDKLKEHNNIGLIEEFTRNCFIIECNKRSEDDLIKTLKCDQILFSDDWDNYFKPLL